MGRFSPRPTFRRHVYVDVRNRYHGRMAAARQAFLHEVATIVDGTRWATLSAEYYVWCGSPLHVGHPVSGWVLRYCCKAFCV